MPRMRAKETAALAKDRHGQKTCEDESAQAKAEILKRGANGMKERFHAAIISTAQPREASFTDARPMIKQASGAGLRCRCTAVGAASPRGCSHIASPCSLRSVDTPQIQEIRGPCRHCHRIRPDDSPPDRVRKIGQIPIEASVQFTEYQSTAAIVLPTIRCLLLNQNDAVRVA